MKLVRRLLVALGAIAMGYAVLGALTDPDVKVVGVLIFLVAVLIVHDLVLLPLVLGAGVLIGRWVPTAARPVVRYAAIAAVAVAVVALPLVLGFGRAADNPSVLPQAYGRGTALVLGMIGASAAVVALIRVRRSRTGARRPGDQP